MTSNQASHQATHPAASQNHQKILSIQVLRGLAAVLVIHSHAIGHQMKLNNGEAWQRQFFHLASFGAVGVDIFFVISGFIITLVARKFVREHGCQDFFAKRLLRILPIYWALTLVELIHAFIRHPERSPLSTTIKSIILLPIFDQENFIFPIISLGWTLSFELYFYLVVALFLLLKRKNFIVQLIAFMGSLVGIGLFVPEISNPLFRFMTNPIIIEFLLGCLIGILYLSGLRLKPNVSYGLLGIAILMFLGTIILGNGDTSRAETILIDDKASIRLLLWGLPSAALVAGLLFLELNQRLQFNRQLILFGDASYSIYLTHYFALTAFTKFWYISRLPFPDLFIILAITFATFLGTGFYLLVEKQLLHYLNCKYQQYCQQRDGRRADSLEWEKEAQ
ncbi:MAG: acyltransferase [Leptolyngbyaceae cyanobacterium]